MGWLDVQTLLPDHFVLEASPALTCSSSRWICSESSCMSESRDRAGLGAGGVKTSSFRGALQDSEGEYSPFPNPIILPIPNARSET